MAWHGKDVILRDSLTPLTAEAAEIKAGEDMTFFLHSSFSYLSARVAGLPRVTSEQKNAD